MGGIKLLDSNENRNEMTLVEKTAAFNKNFFDSVMDSFKQQYEMHQNRDALLPPEVQERLDKIRARIPESARLPVLSPGKPLLNLLKERYNEQQQLKLMKYMTRVQDRASQKMLDDESFAKLFLDKDEFKAVILSLDIRRSTELMLKAESPQLYAEFINAITNELTESVKNRFGIYDKFTGDGLLAFFPDFYSGDKAILYALQCADDCQKIFEAIFSSYRNRFAIGDMVTGLGGGIDVGSVYKAGIELEYTVVGRPVVYACRLSSAPAGHTYLTPLAQNELLKMNCSAFTSNETQIEIKHEGAAKVFDVLPSSDSALETLVVEEPSWCNTVAIKE